MSLGPPAAPPGSPRAARFGSLRAPPRQGGAVAAMVLATALWGATFVMLRDTVACLPPGPLVFLRFAFAAPAMLLTALLLRRRFDGWSVTGGAVGGLLAAGGYAFQAIGLQWTSAGTSAFLTCAGTLLAALFAWPLLGQRPSRLLLGGIVVAIAGSALLSGVGRLGFGPGERWTLLGAASYALQVVVVARVIGRADPLALTAVQALTLAVVMSPFAVEGLARLPACGPEAWARLAYLAVAGSALAPLLQVVAQRTLPPGRIGLLFALEPVFALVFAMAFGGERFVPRWWAGAALILAAVVAVEARALRAEEARARAA